MTAKKGKHPGGRPPKWHPVEIAKELGEYVDSTEIPVVAEFCYKRGIPRAYIYEMGDKCQELSDALKRCIDKKEAKLELLSLQGKVNASQAIFSLKQLGWKDKQEIDQTVSGKDGGPVQIDMSGLSIDELKKLAEKL